MSTEAVGPSPEAAFDAAASTADDFVQRLLDATTTGAELRIGVVTDTENAGDYRVKTSTTGPDFWCASLDAGLRVNDRVLLLKQESAYVAIGRLNGAGSTVPIGVVNPFAGGVVPNGWLICDGSAISRTDYASLFAIIGTSYGGGNGSTTFNVPNLVNRFPLGAGSRSRGATGGAESVTLSEAQIPAHDHSVSGSVGYGGGHTHTYTGPNGYKTVQSGSGVSVIGAHSDGNNVGGDGAHSHSFSGTANNAGGGQSHENMPPFQVLPYIIKAR